MPASRTSAKANSRPGALTSRVQVSEMQRARLLSAAVRTVEDLGYTRATVSHITHRARVSRRTFYELFSNREDCLAAVLENVLESIREEIARAGLEGLPWRERVRGGLFAILSFFDREPAWVRVCVVQSLHGGQGVLDAGEEILRELAAVVDEGRLEGSRGEACPTLTAEGLVGASFAIVYARLLRGDSGPLTDLLGELMGMIVLPYLGPAAARREQDRSAPVSDRGSAASHSASAMTREDGSDLLAGLSMRLTYRTARVLECIAREPGASNRVVGEHAGVSDQGQISKLLGRLECLGLIANGGEGHSKGEPNAWSLTAEGLLVTHTIGAYAHNEEQVARRALPTVDNTTGGT